MAACMWIFTNAVICNGQRKMVVFRNWKRKQSMVRVLPNHEWVSEFVLIVHQHDIQYKLKFDIDVHCIVPFWYSAFTRANSELVNEGPMLETYSLVFGVWSA